MHTVLEQNKQEKQTTTRRRHHTIVAAPVFDRELQRLANDV
jgi:hypothetical protein